MYIKITFLGATKNVTGSRHLIETNSIKLLVDCGLYQERDLKSRNWQDFPYPPDDIDAVLLTHAHLDHSGFLPRFVHCGFNNPIYCTKATADITKIMLIDSARIQEQDAENKKRRHQREKRKGPHPEIPLYSEEDSISCLSLLSPVSYGQSIKLGDSVDFTLYDAGHVLGSEMIKIRIHEKDEERIIIFSGDIGRVDRPILKNPTLFDYADYIVTESTYANRVLPDSEKMLEEFIEVINKTVDGGGNVVIPSFALERAQDILYFLSKAMDSGQLPRLNVYLDSPMAVNITDIFEQYVDLMDENTKNLIRQKKSPFDFPGLKLISTVDESRQINDLTEPAIIIAGSGMCTGGRIKYHLISNITRKESAILFVGYQAVGTLGRSIVDGAKNVRILGKQFPVNAKIVQMNGFSSHADSVQLLRWLYNIKNAPRSVFVVHGEEEAADQLAQMIRNDKGWTVHVPNYQDEFILD